VTRACLTTVVVAFVLFAGCRGTTYTVATGGDAGRGKALIVQYSCGSCHTIPGVKEAGGYQASPLLFFSRRAYIAGQVPNTPDNLVRWIVSPQSIEAGTAMPALGISEQQARDIAAYLYTIK
jgi:cytochrome c